MGAQRVGRNKLPRPALNAQMRTHTQTTASGHLSARNQAQRQLGDTLPATSSVRAGRGFKKAQHPRWNILANRTTATQKMCNAELSCMYMLLINGYLYTQTVLATCARERRLQCHPKQSWRIRHEPDAGRQEIENPGGSRTCCTVRTLRTAQRLSGLASRRMDSSAHRAARALGIETTPLQAPM